jgi:peroxiredoxin
MTLLESLKLDPTVSAFDFSLPGTDDQTHSLADFADAKVLVVIFMCNHCPYVHAVINRLVQIQADYSEKGVQLVGINANDSENYPDDSFESMKEAVQEFGINFPYLHDETQEVAKQYQAQCTPDIYIFDQDRKLSYHGRIDDNWQEPDQVTRHELREALDALLANQKPSEDQKPSMGCSIKWK